MEVILSNLPPPGLFLSTLLGMRVLKTLLARVALSCVTTSINTTTQATCKERGMDNSLVQGGKPGERELVGSVVSSHKVWKPGKALGDVLQGRARPAWTRGGRVTLGTPQVFPCLCVT